MPAKFVYRGVLVAAVLALLIACGASESSPTPIPTRDPNAPPPPTFAPAPKAELRNLDEAQAIGFEYEAFLSPQQEPGEEQNTPKLTPKEFLSTAPSKLRNDRHSRGYGLIRFTNDLSRAYVDVQVDGINAADVNMFHIHCGRPDMLGPILIDFSLATNIQEQLADNSFSVVLTNEDIEKEVAAGHGLVGAFTSGCPVIPGIPGDAMTIAGMQYIAEHGELYFNLHTKGQTFYGEMRGQIHRVER